MDSREFLFAVTDAKLACYDRLHPKPWISTTVGARRLYEAVCELWLLAGELNAVRRRRKHT